MDAHRGGDLGASMAMLVSQTLGVVVSSPSSSSHGGDALTMLHRILLIVFSTLFTFLVQRIVEASCNGARQLSYDGVRTAGCNLLRLQVTITESSYDCYVKASDAAKAVLYYLDKHQASVPQLRRMREMFVSSFLVSVVSGSLGGMDTGTRQIPDQRGWVRLDAHVDCKVDVKTDVYEKSRMHRVEITLSTRRPRAALQRFVDKCLAEHDGDVQEQLHACKYTFLLTTVKEQGLVFTQVPFLSNKSFDTMFFPEKDALLQRIDHFLRRRDQYDRVGMPYTLGILLHGPAGTGKTSCIKAIARHMGRHVVLVPTSLVKSKETLLRLFCDDKFNDKHVPMAQRLYVFEEIDCGAWSRIVADRHCLSQVHSQAQSLSQVLAPAGPCTMHQQAPSPEAQGVRPGRMVGVAAKKEEEELTLTLGDILEMLDGIIETPGRAIVFTTNFPERLDKALLRPGRINLKIGFKRLDRASVRSMYRVWFSGDDIPDAVYARMKDGRFTQAELGELFGSHIGMRKALLHALTRDEPRA